VDGWLGRVRSARISLAFEFIVPAGDVSGIQVFPQPGIQIVTDRDLAHFAAFFAKAQGAPRELSPRATGRDP
jgi:hypothetical protein